MSPSTVHEHAPLTSPDDVVAALDQRRVPDGRRSWVVNVVGIHLAGSHLWIQIERKCRPRESLILRIVPGATAADVLRALIRQPPRPDRQCIVSIFPMPCVQAGARVH